MESLTPIAAAVGGTVALLAFLWMLRQPRSRRYVGPAADWWETLRSVLLPLLEQHAPRIKFTYTLHEREHAGVIDAPPEQVEQVLWKHGFRRMPFAAFKTLSDGTEEVGSWAYRESLLAEEQLHVMLFPDQDGTAVYAHLEANALNPFTALAHYRGDGYNPEQGAKKLRDTLPSGVWDER